MRSKMLAAVGSMVLAGALATSASAQTNGGDVDSVSGTATGAIGTLTVDAQKPADAPSSDATGEFSADATLLPFSFNGERPGMRDLPFFASLPAVHLEGPVTCLDVQGDRAGFIYPVDESDPEFFQEGQAVLITVQDNGPDEADAAGFYGPAPIGQFNDACPPQLPTYLTALDGDLEVTDGSE